MDYNQDPCVIVDRLMQHVKSSQKVAQIASSIILKPITQAFVKDRVAKRKKWMTTLQKLLQNPQIEQRSDEWYERRWNLITASDLAQSLGCGKFGTQRDFYVKKCDESTSRASLPALPPLVWGVKYEPVAATIYEKMNNTKLHEFGLLQHQKFPFIGASPDGITSEGIMVEIKCPYARKPKPEVPTQYYYQIQSQLDVCDLDECDYFECRFKEYSSEEEFVRDTHPEHPGSLLSTTEYPKGIIIEHKLTNGNTSYEYCQEESLSAALEWVKKEHKQSTNVNTTVNTNVKGNASATKLTYWYLESVNLIRVYRDVDFIHHQYEKAKKVWDNVLRYRSDSASFRKEVVLDGKECDADSAEECIIDTDSD